MYSRETSLSCAAISCEGKAPVLRAAARKVCGDELQAGCSTFLMYACSAPQKLSRQISDETHARASCGEVGSATGAGAGAAHGRAACAHRPLARLSGGRPRARPEAGARPGRWCTVAARAAWGCYQRSRPLAHCMQGWRRRSHTTASRCCSTRSRPAPHQPASPPQRVASLRRSRVWSEPPRSEPAFSSPLIAQRCQR